MAIKISKEDWVEWCKNPVTERFLMDFQDKVNREVWSLAEGAGSDSTLDARSSGKITAWGETLNWRPEEFMVDGVTLHEQEGEVEDDDE